MRRKSGRVAQKRFVIPMFAYACIHAEDNLLDANFDLTDKEGILAAKMKIVFSRISGSGDNIEEFMKKVDDDISLMSSLPCWNEDFVCELQGAQTSEYYVIIARYI